MGSCATQGEKAAIIKELREEGYQLKYLLKGLNMSKSTYYYELKCLSSAVAGGVLVSDSVFILAVILESD